MNLVAQNASVSSAKIAIIDDDQSVGYAIQRMIQAETDYETLLACSGKEALKLVRKELPDLVILDIVMPGMSGLEVLKRIKSNSWTLHVPVIMFTGYADEKNLDESGYWYADAFLSKSCGRAKLLSTVDSVLSVRNRNNR